MRQPLRRSAHTFHDARCTFAQLDTWCHQRRFALEADIAGIAVLRSLGELRTAKPEGTLKAQKPEEDAKADSVAAQGFTAENRADATQTDPALKKRWRKPCRPLALHGNEQADIALPAAGLSGAAPLAAPSHDPGIERITSPFTPQTPVKQVVQTIANNLHMSPGQMNLTLTPDTLGRVHFEMRPEQNGLSITLSAENPDTLDLMRRHLPDLVAELKQAGIQAGNFSFSSWQDRPQAIAPPPVEAAEPEFPIPLAPTPLLRPVSSAPKGALDLRV